MAVTVFTMRIYGGNISYPTFLNNFPLFVNRKTFRCFSLFKVSLFEARCAKSLTSNAICSSGTLSRSINLRCAGVFIKSHAGCHETLTLKKAVIFHTKNYLPCFAGVSHALNSKAVKTPSGRKNLYPIGNKQNRFIEIGDFE